MGFFQDAPWINVLTDTVKQAVPLNPARVWAGVESLEFGQTLVLRLHSKDSFEGEGDK